MSEEKIIYPLSDCYSCIHNRVCKFIDTLNNTELPLTLYDSVCKEFTDNYTEEELNGIMGYFHDDIQEPEELGEEDESVRIEIDGGEDIGYGTSLLLAIQDQILDFEESGILIHEVSVSESDRLSLSEILEEEDMIGSLIINNRSIKITVTEGLSPRQALFFHEH